MTTLPLASEIFDIEQLVWDHVTQVGVGQKREIEQGVDNEAFVRGLIHDVFMVSTRFSRPIDRKLVRLVLLAHGATRIDVVDDTSSSNHSK